MSSATGRRFYRTSRTGENFTENGLKSITGQSKSDWGIYTAKELIDNALEASNDDDDDDGDGVAISVDIETCGIKQSTNRHVETMTVSDDGPGMDEDTIHGVFGELDHFVGDKRLYQLPTRGNQGNALMSILGIQYARNKERPLIVHSRGQEYAIQAYEDGETYNTDIRKTKSSDVSGFGVTVDFGRDNPLFYCEEVKSTVVKLAVLNPQAEFSMTIDGETTYLPPIPDSSVTPGTDTELATWFSFDEFENRYQGDQQVEPEMTLREFVGQFHGLKSKTDDIVGDDADQQMAEADPIAVGNQDSETEEDVLKPIYERACEETTDRSENGLDSTIGSIGDDLTDRLHGYVDDGPQDIVARIDRDGFENLDDITVYYGDGGSYSEGEKTVPFYFELAVVPTNIVEKDGYTDANLLFGVNQSVQYENPRINLDRSETDGNAGIQPAFRSLGHDFTVVTNLYCPNIDFKDKGKQGFDTDPFKHGISAIVGKALRKVKRDIRPRLNDLRDDEPEETLENKAHNGFIKGFVEENFWEIYNEATDDGRYSITMRQFLYNMRPPFKAEASRRGYEYSSKASIDDDEPKKLELSQQRFREIVTDFEEENVGERIVERDERGFFVEPHTNQRINLGTKAVRDYEPDIDQYSDILFVEKTGFMDNLHREFELTKKYDIGLINSKGWNTNAGRKLVEKIQAANPDATMYVLSDFDVAGIGIAENVAEPDALSELDRLTVEKIGISYDSVQKYDLPPEPEDYDDSTITQLDNHYKDGDIGVDAYEFLKKDGGQRVEINAFSPVKLRDFLETTFEEHDIEKVHPDDDDDDIQSPDIKDSDTVRTDTIDAAVGQWVISQLDEDVYEYLRDTVTVDEEIDDDLDDLEVDTGDIRDHINDELADNPSEHWTDINEEFVEERENDAEDIIEQYENTITGATEDYLDDNHSVTFE